MTIVVHEICTSNGLSIANEDRVVQAREIRVWISHSHAGLRSGDKQAVEEI